MNFYGMTFLVIDIRSSHSKVLVTENKMRVGIPSGPRITPAKSGFRSASLYDPFEILCRLDRLSRVCGSRSAYH
jgi:hypothetical protein